MLEDESPAEIVLGIKKIDLRVKNIEFGAYAQAWYQTKNTMIKRSCNPIALEPSNERGAHYFMN